MSKSTVALLPGGVWLLTLQSDDTQHRFDDIAIQTLHGCLDTVETFVSNPLNVGKGPFALVTWGGRGKFFSNGLSLEHLAALGKACGDDAHTKDGDALPPGVFLRDFARLLVRFLTLGMPTVAAINGHAYAGGCMLAMAHDRRVMVSGRFRLCLNEVLIGMGTSREVPLTGVVDWGK